MPQSALETVNELVAGSFGGAAQVLVGQPLDTIKTRAQIAPSSKGPMDILTGTVRKEGVLALYKGMTSPLLGIAGVTSLVFGAYGISKRIISPFGQLSLKETAAAGAMAGAANSVLASPVEMFKPGDKRLRVVVREMWAEWGLRRGVMRGFWFSKRKFVSILGPDLPVWALLASGSTGGVRPASSAYSIHVVKSRVQLRSTPPKGTPVQYIAHELKAVVSESGAAGLFRGLTPCPTYFLLLSKRPCSIPAAGATFATFELIEVQHLRGLTGI
ncbi:mitochondrial carrier domain-containing protein [Russula dissimulans]|nr:mitochondrial carrier domain-containing protein [Russula dissimulans]